MSRTTPEPSPHGFADDRRLSAAIKRTHRGKTPPKAGMDARRDGVNAPSPLVLPGLLSDQLSREQLESQSPQSVNLRSHKLVKDVKEQIAETVRAIDNLSRQIEEQWAKAQKRVFENQLDDAITILNAYYRTQTKREQAEGKLKGILSGYFADK